MEEKYILPDSEVVMLSRNQYAYKIKYEVNVNKLFQKFKGKNYYQYRRQLMIEYVENSPLVQTSLEWATFFKVGNSNIRSAFRQAGVIKLFQTSENARKDVVDLRNEYPGISPMEIARKLQKPIDNVDSYFKYKTTGKTKLINMSDEFEVENSDAMDFRVSKKVQKLKKIKNGKVEYHGNWHKSELPLTGFISEYNNIKIYSCV